MSPSATEARSPSETTRLRELLKAAHASILSMEPREALRHVVEILRIARRIGRTSAIVEALAIATLAHYYRGDYVAVVATGLDACDAVAGERDLSGVSLSLNCVALAFTAVQDFARAESAARGAVEAAVEAGDRLREGTAHSALGAALAESGDLDAAFVAFRRAFRSFRRAGDLSRLKRTLVNAGAVLGRRGNALDRKGDARTARRYWIRSNRYYRLAIHVEGSRLDDIHAHAAHAENVMHMGRLAEALAEYEAAAARLRPGDLSLVTGYVAYMRGETERRMRRWPAAERHLRQAIELLDANMFDANPADCRESLALTCEATGRVEEAHAWREEARELRAARERRRDAFRREMDSLWDRYVKKARPM